MRTDHLLFGAAYYLEYLPYDRLETDMEMMERAGMNTIRIAESTWSTLEPSDNSVKDIGIADDVGHDILQRFDEMVDTDR